MAARLSGVETRDRYLAILDDVRALPGVEGASLTGSVPLSGPSRGFPITTVMDVEGHEPMPGAPSPRAAFRVVSPGYFSTLGIDLLKFSDKRCCVTAQCGLLLRVV